MYVAYRSDKYEYEIGDRYRHTKGQRVSAEQSGRGHFPEPPSKLRSARRAFATDSKGKFGLGWVQISTQGAGEPNLLGDLLVRVGHEDLQVARRVHLLNGGFIGRCACITGTYIG